MRSFILFTGVLFLFYPVYAQDITKGQLMDLHYKAMRAEKANNMKEALDIYKTILSIDPALPVPYLRMANIYASDESNKESVAVAIALYNKYLNLQPNDENTTAIKAKTAYLQKLVSTQPNVNVTDLLNINKEQAQNIIATKTRRGIKAATKEELEQQVAKVTALYDQAWKAINNNDAAAGVKYAEQLSEQTDQANPLTVQTNMMVAELYGKQGDLNKMQNELASLKENMTIYKELQQYNSTMLKDSLSFEDEICGIWVSDLAYNDITPFLVLEIVKNNTQTNNYTAKILPYCILAEQYKMYTGKPFQYQAKYNDKTRSRFAYSSIDSVYVKSGRAYFYFGNKRFAGTGENLDKYLIKPVINTMGIVTKGALETAAGNFLQSVSKAKIPVAGVGIEIVNSLVQLGISLATVKKTTEINLELNMQRLFAGCADINFIHNVFNETKTGYEQKSIDSLQLRIYKLSPEDRIFFSGDENELFGYKTFKKNEMLPMVEYRHLLALKSKSEFNKEAYKKLSEKISDFCFSKAPENPEFKDIAYQCRMRFEYASKGLSYRTFETKDGVFQGWIDLSGKMNGIGKCTLYNGTTYIGSWENNKYSGTGTITFPDGITGETIEEYTGTFVNNRYHGKGLLRRSAILYDGDFFAGVFEGIGKLTDANKAVYIGTWKNDKPVSGTITYINGDRYTGQCSYDEEAQRIERQGQGTMVYASGEKISGIWENNEYRK